MYITYLVELNSCLCMWCSRNFRRMKVRVVAWVHTCTACMHIYTASQLIWLHLLTYVYTVLYLPIWQLLMIMKFCKTQALENQYRSVNVWYMIYLYSTLFDDIYPTKGPNLLIYGLGKTRPMQAYVVVGEDGMWAVSTVRRSLYPT